MKSLPHSRPWITIDDRKAVESVLLSGMLDKGERVQAFEKAVASYVGAPYAFSCPSGTSALVIALKAFGVGNGSEVVIPTYVCKSVLDAVRETGATPVICDVGKEWNMTVDSVARCINKRTSAIIAVDIFGLLVDVKALQESFSVPVIEDACQAFGATRQGKKVMAESDCSTFSFHATKCLTTGEGGMAVFRDAERGDFAKRLLASYPLSDLSAALGMRQLSRYHQFLERRKNLAQIYHEFFSERQYPGTILPPENDYYFRFVLRTPFSPDDLIKRFAQKGVAVRKGVDALLHREIGLTDDLFPNAAKLFNSSISLPFYPSLTEAEIEQTFSACQSVFSECYDDS